MYQFYCFDRNFDINVVTYDYDVQYKPSYQASAFGYWFGYTTGGKTLKICKPTYFPRVLFHGKKSKTLKFISMYH